MDEELVERVRAPLVAREDLEEKHMFGGLTFMVAGHMCCGVSRRGVMLRLGAEGAESALADPAVRPMDFTGRPLTGMVFLDPEDVGDATLRAWIERAVAFVETLSARDT